MGKIIACCGHEISLEEMRTGSLSFATWEGEDRVISTGVYCPECKDWFKYYMSEEIKEAERMLNEQEIEDSYYKDKKRPMKKHGRSIFRIYRDSILKRLKK